MLRFAIRKFGPFEQAIKQQFDDFRVQAGIDCELELKALDLDPHYETLFGPSGLKDGGVDIGLVVTDWLPMAARDGHHLNLAPFIETNPPPDYPGDWCPSLIRLQQIDGGVFGDITDISIHLTLRQPWELWPFMADLEAVEVIMHSIHYLDWIRSVLGEPRGVYCHSVKHPDHPALADARTSTILDYGDHMRCCLSLNHTWKHGGPHQEAGVRIDGQEGAAYVKLGLLLNYPKGEPEEVQVKAEGTDWISVPMDGRWFPDAFIGVMSNLQRFASGEDAHLHTAVEDAARTMALVEACWQSSRSGATPVPEL